MTKTTNADKVRKEILNRFQRATSNGSSIIEIHARELHDSVEFNEGTHPNQMPNVCRLMHEASRSSDHVTHGPPKGRGGSLRIAYRVPRGY